MERSKSNKIALIFIGLLIVMLLGFIIYERFIKEDKETAPTNITNEAYNLAEDLTFANVE